MLSAQMMKDYYTEALEDNGVSDKLPRQLTFLEPKSNTQFVAEWTIEEEDYIQYVLKQNDEEIGDVVWNKQRKSYYQKNYLLIPMYQDAADQLENLLRMY